MHQQLLLLCLLIGVASTKIVEKAYEPPDYVYHSASLLKSYLNNVVAEYPSMTHLYELGNSVEGRPLYVLAISATQPSNHVFLRPEVKLIATVHGNTVSGREILVQLIDYLLANYGFDDDVTNILDSTRVHILPTMNPDGAEQAYQMLGTSGDCEAIMGKKNANSVDLNRNFPDYFTTNINPLQPETSLIIEWLNHTQFVLSATLSSGALVTTYPYDNNAQNMLAYSATPDDDIFRYLAQTYSHAHPEMSMGPHCGSSFQSGIANGAQWYPIAGGMQDYNYVFAGCFEVTVMVGCCRYPPENQTEQLWEDNRDSVINFIKQAHLGVKGIVTNENGDAIANVKVMVADREVHPMLTSSTGEFFRLLLPGDHVLIFEHEDYATVEHEVSIKASLQQSSISRQESSEAERIKVVMTPPAEVTSQSQSVQTTTTQDDGEDIEVEVGHLKVTTKKVSEATKSSASLNFPHISLTTKNLLGVVIAAMLYWLSFYTVSYV